MKPELEKVRLEEMEKLILLADDVLTQVGWHFIYYNEQGVSLEELCKRDDGSVDEAQWWNEMNENRKKEELSMMVKMFLHEQVSVTDVRYESAENILKRLEPLKSRVIGVFRHGAEQNTVMNETNYYADESIPDETLLELFAMRVRDRRLLFALQRENRKREETEELVAFADTEFKLEHISLSELEKSVERQEKDITREMKLKSYKDNDIGIYDEEGNLVGEIEND